MMNNIILNGISSDTINGLLIQELPAISKPAIRTEIEEIDGRDGDVITKLGYAAYDKQLSIGLYGNYDINQVISFFDTSGVVTFSNEPDKYYNYQILNEIDFERLVRFRTAIVTMHVQPFKYSATETPQELSGTVVTGEGTNINLVNTTDSGLFTDLQMKGDTFQQTYSGKNLFDKDNANIINGSFSASDSITINNNVRSLYIPCKPNTTYTITKNITSNRYRAGTTNSLPVLGVSVQNVYSNDGGKLLSVTSDSNSQYLIVYFWVNGDISTEQQILDSIQIEEGSTATPYEPYVGGIPSPNPDYPQDVKTVTGDNTITICGKNLFDKDNANILNGVYIDGTTDTIKASTTAKTLYIPCKSNTTYTISKIQSSRFTVAPTIDIPALSVATETHITNNSATNITITTTNNSKYLCVFYYTSNYDTTITEQEILNSIQIEQGSTATPYEAYQSQTYPISLGNIELCEINGAYDYIYKNNGSWYLHKKIGKTVLNGSEDWRLISGSVFQTQSVLPTNLGDRTNGISNSYQFAYYQSAIGSSIKNNEFGWNANNYLTIRDDRYTTLNNFKTGLSTLTPNVYYLLATATDTEITDSTLLSQLNALGNATTYLGVTNIIVSGSVLTPILYVQTVAVDDPVLKITNSGNTTAKPIMTLYGTGTINLSLNGEQIFVIDLSSENYITIDVANMEAYYNGILKNRLVTGNYENFVLNQGENEITFTGTLYSLTISNYSRWI